MSLQDIRVRTETELNNIYTALEEQGATIPEQKNLINVTPAIKTITGSSGVIELSYLESTGTQYIDTEYLPYKTKTEVTFQMPTKPSGIEYTYIIASWNTDNNRYYPVIYNGGDEGFNTADKNNSLTKLGEYDTSIHTVIYNDEQNKVYYDGVEKATVSDLTTQATNSIYLFAVHSSNGAEQLFTGRIMNVKMTDKETNTLVKNLIPVLDENYIPCLYDLVEEKYYYNMGTGNFIAGPITGNIEKNQVHNYLMLYDGTLGEAGENGANVCADVTGGWEINKHIKSKHVAGTGILDKNRIYLKATSTGATDQMSTFTTANAINVENYEKACLISNGDFVNNEVHSWSSSLLGDVKTCDWDGQNESAGLGLSTDGTTKVSVSVSLSEKTIKDFYLQGFISATDSSGSAEVSIYSAFLVKQDSYQQILNLAGITTTYTDEASICGDETAMTTILNNRAAVIYMIYNCTGTFMSAFLQSQTALNALNASPYKVLVYQNDVWIKFLSMVA